MQNNAKVGGVLSIISGAFGVLGFLVCIIVAVLVMLMPGDFNSYSYNSRIGGDVSTLIAVVCIVVGIFCAIVGVLAVVGGIFALKKRYWGWALAGAIGGMLAFFPCGIPAIIFVVMGKPEFKKAVPVAPAPPPTIIG